MQQPKQQGFDITGFFSIQLEVLLREEFGERYHTVGLVILVLGWLTGITALFTLGIRLGEYQMLKPAPVTAALFGILAVSFLLTSIQHQVAIFIRHRSGQHVFSWSSGKPHKLWFSLLTVRDDLNGQYTIRRFLEPVPFLFIGGFIYLYVSQVFGVYLLVCNGSMWIKSFSHYLAWKNLRLDLADAPIRNQAVRNNEDNEIVAVVSSPLKGNAPGVAKDLSVPSVIKRIDPALRAIMEGQEDR